MHSRNSYHRHGRCAWVAAQLRSHGDQSRRYRSRDVLRLTPRTSKSWERDRSACVISCSCRLAGRRPGIRDRADDQRPVVRRAAGWITPAADANSLAAIRRTTGHVRGKQNRHFVASRACGRALLARRVDHQLGPGMPFRDRDTASLIETTQASPAEQILVHGGQRADVEGISRRRSKAAEREDATFESLSSKERGAKELDRVRTRKQFGTRDLSRCAPLDDSVECQSWMFTNSIPTRRLPIMQAPLCRKHCRRHGLRVQDRLKKEHGCQSALARANRRSLCPAEREGSDLLRATARGRIVTGRAEIGGSGAARAAATPLRPAARRGHLSSSPSPLPEYALSRHHQPRSDGRPRRHKRCIAGSSNDVANGFATK